MEASVCRVVFKPAEPPVQTNDSLFPHTAEGLSLYGAHEIGQLSAHQSLSETTSK